MSLPLAVILKEIESAPADIIPVLSSLHYDTQILKNISNSDRNHLVARTLKLSRANDVYSVWCGVNLIYVLCEDFQILSEHGSVIIGQLIKMIERHLTKDRKKPVLTSSVQALVKLCDAVRGKPTLTREIMTPKLPTIISLYYENLDLEPELFLDALHRLIKHHPTTFRPFGNKLRAKLVALITSSGFLSYTADLKRQIYKTLALLPVIEKVDPEVKWQQDVISIIKEATHVLLIYKEFLNFQDDNALSNRAKDLTNLSGSGFIFEKPLKVETEDPKSLLAINERFSTLMELLTKYIETETSFPVNVPLGQALSLADVACSINTRFLAYKRDVFDPELRNMVKTSIGFCHESVSKFLVSLPAVYGKTLSVHLKNTLALLETLLPFSNKKLDVEAVKANEPLMCQLLECAASWMRLSNMINATSVVRLLDVALILVQPTVLNSIATTNKKTAESNGKKQKKKKNSNSAAMSDLLSHGSHFIIEATPLVINTVRSFLLESVTRVQLPHTQHHKIIRYIIIESVNAIKTRSVITEDLKDLLVNAVLYPGLESTSILPLVSNLLPANEVIGLFNNPRFPPLPQIVKRPETYNLEDDLEDLDQENVGEIQQISTEVDIEQEKPNVFKRSSFSEESSAKKQKVEGTILESTTTIPKIQNTLVEPIEVETIIETAIVTEPVEVASVPEIEPVSIVAETVTLTEVDPISAHGEEDNESDFEMPEIDAGDDSD